MGGGDYATPHTDRMGSDAEQAFQTVCHHHKITVKPSTKQQNIYQHFDFVVSPFWDKDRSRVEVKAIKCAGRGKVPDPSLIYVEFQTVGGHPGWIYGSADHIALQQDKTEFLVVRRTDLLTFAENVRKTAGMGQRSGIKGTLWTREGRDDLVISLDRNSITDAIPYYMFSVAPHTACTPGESSFPPAPASSACETADLPSQSDASCEFPPSGPLPKSPRGSA